VRRIIRVVQRLIRPFVSWNYLAGAPTRMSAGVPNDRPHGSIEGPKPYQILVVGGMSGSGIGISSFHQSVASVLAGCLSRSSGRGADWESTGGSNLRLAATSAALFAQSGLASFDVIVVSPGVADALAFVSIRRWRAELERLLAELAKRTKPDALVLVTGVADVAKYVQVGPFLSSMLTRDALHLTATVEASCANAPKARFIELPPVASDDFVEGAYSYSRLYRRWGRFLADTVLTLEIERQTAD
jgi:hypothetical protein